MTNNETPAIPFPIGTNVKWEHGSGYVEYGIVVDLDSSSRYRWVKKNHEPFAIPFSIHVDELRYS